MADADRAGSWTVAAVIPTIGGPYLAEAVDSALAQTHPGVTVVVVVDGPGPAQLPARLTTDPRVSVVATPVNGGAGAARLFGLGATDAEWIAFLDDDDTWAPDKIARQVAAVRAEAAATGRADRIVAACRVERVTADGTPIDVVPHRLIEPGDGVAEYLFVRQTLDPFEAVLSPSMLLMHRSAASRIAAVHEQRLHEDWAHLLVLEAELAVRLVMLPQALVRFRVHATGASGSTRTSWRASRDWFDAHRAQLSDRAYAEGLLLVTAPLARAQHDRRGWWEVVRDARRVRAASARAWTTLAVVSLVPPGARRRLVSARAAAAGRGRAARPDDEPAS
jgi:glycosyltransferase involved in cell wall biosynthesis